MGSDNLRYVKYGFALLIIVWTIVNFALQVHEPNNQGEGAYQFAVDLVSGQIFALVALYSIIGLAVAMAADLRNNFGDSMMATFVNLSLWLTWWIQLFWLVLFIFKVGGAFDNYCTYIDQVNTFYCDTAKTVGALAIIYMILLSVLVGVCGYEAYTLSQTRPQKPNLVLLGLVVAGFVGQFFWACATVSLAQDNDAFAALDPQLLLDVVLVNLIFTAWVGFMARVIYGGTQTTAHLGMLVACVTACMGWSLVIIDGRRLSDTMTFFTFGGGGNPPCNGGVHCAETVVMFIGLLLMTLMPTASAVFTFVIKKDLPAENNTRTDMLLNSSNDHDTGTYQPVVQYQPVQPMAGLRGGANSRIG